MSGQTVTGITGVGKFSSLTITQLRQPVGFGSDPITFVDYAHQSQDVPFSIQ